MDDYKDFSEDERIFYLREAGFDSREKELFRLRVYEEKTLAEASEIMGYSTRTVDRMVKKRYWVDAEELVCNILADYGQFVIGTARDILGNKFTYVAPVGAERMIVA